MPSPRGVSYLDGIAQLLVMSNTASNRRIFTIQDQYTTTPAMSDANCNTCDDAGDLGAFVQAYTDPSGYQQQFGVSPLAATDYNTNGSIDPSDTYNFMNGLSANTLAKKGDMTEDGNLDINDVQPFVDYLLGEDGSIPGQEPYATMKKWRADANVDQVVDGGDIQPFVAALLAP